MPAPHLSTPRPIVCHCGSIFDTHQHLHEHVNQKGHRYACAVQGCHVIAGDAAVIAISSRHSGSGHAGVVEPPAYIRHVREPELKTVEGKKCGICGKSHQQADDLTQHKRDSHHICPTYHQVSSSKQQLEGHKRNFGHCYCHEHSLSFSDRKAFRKHERGEPHITGFECLDCGRHYTSQRALDDHLGSCQAQDPVRIAEQQASADNAAAAFARVEEANLRCESCDRTFPNLKAQRQHKDSVKHKPLSELRCFLSPSCTKVFTSPSAFILHLESGGCKSGMTRHKLNCLVHAADPANRITYKHNTHRLAPGAQQDAASLLTALDRLSVSSDSGVILTPSQSTTTSTMSVRGRGRVLTPLGSDDGSAASSSAVRDGARSVSIASASTVRAFPRHGATDTPHPGNPTAGEVTGGFVEEDDSSSVGGAVLTPSFTATSSTGGVRLPPESSAAGEWSFVSSCQGEGSGLRFDEARQLWRCDICSAGFKSQGDLLQHANSPTHESKLYHCAGVAAVASSGAKKKPVKNFKTLSGFAQHVEAGSCTGGKDILKTVVDILRTR